MQVQKARMARAWSVAAGDWEVELLSLWPSSTSRMMAAVGVEPSKDEDLNARRGARESEMAGARDEEALRLAGKVMIKRWRE